MMVEQKEIKHGTEGGYSKGGCRCDACKKAKAEYRLKNPVNKHGTTWGYDKGCRCNLCRIAKAESRERKYSDSRSSVIDARDRVRRCATCGIVKPLEDFHKNSRQFLARDHHCKLCRNRRSRECKNTPNQRFSTYRSGAKVRNISFALSFEEFMSFWDKPCFYCGDGINGIGLDRRSPELGYSVENIVPCCSQCNRAKTIQTTEEFISMCLKVAERFKNHIVSPREK